MSEWKTKRFWKEAGIEEAEGGYSVHLDGRPVKTPAKSRLVVPNRPLAEAIAAEWDAQEGAVDPLTMPVTRSANAAIDKVKPQFEEVVRIVADYGGTDLLCYRAEAPAELVRRQAEAWDPPLDWAAGTLGAPLKTAAGVMHVRQPAGSLDILAAKVREMDAFRLAAFHDLVALSGSLILGLTVTHRVLDPATAWERSRIDETWQEEQWGVDEEAREAAVNKRSSFMTAAEIYVLASRR